MIIHLENSADFDKVINEHNKVIIDFYAQWCGPCKMLAPMLEKVASTKPDWTIVKIDTDNHQELAAKFAVSAIPTLVFIVNQQVKDISQGFMPDSEIIKIINKF